MYCENIIETFQSLYGENGGEIRLFFAPGRVNLIGDHTDYSGGHVFPCAIREGITAAVRRREDGEIRFAGNKDGITETGAIFLNQPPEYRKEDRWRNGPKGVIRTLEEQGVILPHGLDILFMGDLSPGEGLSSSSALEVLTALIVREMYGLPGMDALELAMIAKKTDNVFFGGARGIMDPLACAVGREGCGILLSVDKVKYEYVPLKLGDASLVLTLSGVDYAAKEKFETIFALCRKALKRLQSVAYIEKLCNLTWDKFESCKDVIMDEAATKVARHVIYEDARTIRAVSALRVGNIQRFAQMMKESHISLRDNCGVTCPEIDFLVERSWQIPGVIGSRMTGAGFGGSTVSIVKNSAVDDFRETLGREYREKFGLTARFLVTGAGEGAREIQLP